MGGSLHAGHGDHIEGMLVHWSRHRANMSAILCQDCRLLESWLMRAAAWMSASRGTCYVVAAIEADAAKRIAHALL